MTDRGRATLTIHHAGHPWMLDYPIGGMEAWVDPVENTQPGDKTRTYLPGECHVRLNGLAARLPGLWRALVGKVVDVKVHDKATGRDYQFQGVMGRMTGTTTVQVDRVQ